MIDPNFTVSQIKSLEAEIDRLRAALREVKWMVDPSRWEHINSIAKLDDAALSGEGGVMSDVVERLRFAARDPAGTDTHVAIYRDLCAEAADEIERLRAAPDRAREAAHRGLKAWVGVQSAQGLIHALETVIAELDGALSGQGDAQSRQYRPQNPNQR